MGVSNKLKSILSLYWQIHGLLLQIRTETLSRSVAAGTSVQRKAASATRHSKQTGVIKHHFFFPNLSLVFNYATLNHCEYVQGCFPETSAPFSSVGLPYLSKAGVYEHTHSLEKPGLNLCEILYFHQLQMPVSIPNWLPLTNSVPTN